MKKKIAILSLTFACAAAFGGSSLASNTTDLQSQINNSLNKLETYANMSYDWTTPQNMILNDDYSLFYSNGNYSLQNMREYMMYGGFTPNLYNQTPNTNTGYNGANYNGISNNLRNVNYSSTTNQNTTYTPTKNLNTNQNTSSNMGRVSNTTNNNASNLSSNRMTNSGVNYNQTTNRSTTNNMTTQSTNKTGTNLTSNSNMKSQNLNNTSTNPTRTQNSNSSNNNSNLTTLEIRDDSNFTNNMQGLTTDVASTRSLTDYSSSLSTAGTSLMANITQAKANLSNAQFNGLDQSKMRSLRAYAYTLNNIARKVEFGQQDLLSNITRMSILQSASNETGAVDACNLDVKATLASRVALLECANEAITQINRILSNQTSTTQNTTANNTNSNQTLINNSNTTNKVQNSNNFNNTTTQTIQNGTTNKTNTNKTMQSKPTTAVTTSAPAVECEDCKKNTSKLAKKETRPMKEKSQIRAGEKPVIQNEQEVNVKQPNKEKLEKSIAETLHEKDTKDIKEKPSFFKKFKKQSTENEKVQSE